MSTVVAIQGEVASFHDIAARQFLGTSITPLGCDTFKEVFAAVHEGRAAYAVCAIENSLFGSINEVYDLLAASHFPIVGEVYLRIEQCLIGLPGAALDAIKEVHSHPVALAQCEAYLDTVLPHAKRFESHDTAASVAMVKRLGDPAVAAIAGRQAAALHQLTVLAAEIETNPQNYTRFVVLAPSPAPAQTATKTSLIIRTNHQPGALYAALGAFAQRGLNLSKLQSRPVIGSAWNYLFYVDVEAGVGLPALTAALDELAAQKCTVTVLGSYPAGAKAT